MFLLLRFRRQRFLIFSLTVIGLGTWVSCFVMEDYLFGPRGLFRALVSGFYSAESSTSAAPTASLASWIPYDAFLKAGYEVVLGFLAALPLMLFGCWTWMQSLEGRRRVLAIFSFAGLSFFFGAAHPTVPVQLPTYILLSIVARNPRTTS